MRSTRQRLVILICLSLLFLSSLSFASTASKIEGILKSANAKPGEAFVERRKNAHLSDYHFVFIFKSTCPHCHQFSPVLKSFSRTYHLPVTAYSTDGGKLPEFPSRQLTPARFQKFFAEGNYAPAVPALFLVNDVTHQSYAVLFGETSAPQLMRRMNVLMKDIEVSYER